MPPLESRRFFLTFLPQLQTFLPRAEKKSASGKKCFEGTPNVWHSTTPTPFSGFKDIFAELTYASQCASELNGDARELLAMRT